MKMISILVLVLIGSAVSQAGQSASPQQVRVSLCDLLAYPNEYAGKLVTVKATIASGMEFAIVTDHSCQPAPDKSKLVLATFGSKYQFKAPIAKKLSKLLKRSQQAAVTVLAVFTGPGHYVGHQNCCRYKLEVQQLLDVEQLKPKAVHDGKDQHSDLRLEYTSVPTFPQMVLVTRIFEIVSAGDGCGQVVNTKV